MLDSDDAPPLRTMDAEKRKAPWVEVIAWYSICDEERHDEGPCDGCELEAEIIDSHGVHAPACFQDEVYSIGLHEVLREVLADIWKSPGVRVGLSFHYSRDYWGEYDSWTEVTSLDVVPEWTCSLADGLRGLADLLHAGARENVASLYRVGSSMQGYEWGAENERKRWLSENMCAINETPWNEDGPLVSQWGHYSKVIR